PRASAPSLQTRLERAVQGQAFAGEKTEMLLVLCFRRYQAFQGKIALEQADEERLRHALQQAQKTVCLLFASPWALPQNTNAQATIFTFSPAPAFQQTAAEVLLRDRIAQGQLPVSL
ncbi:MAG: hypothetical protein MJ053_05575, partial [Elusimicrobiaceae bacterium]|nr:hypothetical protein [Elusimicrobiaceae bacterium]